MFEPLKMGRNVVSGVSSKKFSFFFFVLQVKSSTLNNRQLGLGNFINETQIKFFCRDSN